MGQESPSQKKLLQESLGVIPAEAGIQVSQAPLDPGFCRGDGILESGVSRMIWLYLSHLGFNEKQIRERTYEKLY
jgi:hypothetical protein